MKIKTKIVTTIVAILALPILVFAQASNPWKPATTGGTTYLTPVVNGWSLQVPGVTGGAGCAQIGSTGIFTSTGSSCLTPSTAVTSIVAGTNISISGATGAVTINATGGAGGAAGTFSTSTSGISGQLFNYPNNTSDIVLVGGFSSTTAKYWFDPNTLNALLGNSNTASTTIMGLFNLPSISQGYAYLGSNGRFNTVASSSVAVGTATALAANPTNCSAGSYPLGVDASGNVESCTVATTGTVTAVSVASANGFTGSSSGGATPALTLTTSITGVLKGNATAISAAANGTDYTLITANTCGAGNHVSAITAAGIISCSADTGSGGSFSFPFDAQSYGVSTTTTLAFLNGLFSTASSTFSGALRLSSLAQGNLYIGSTGLVATSATSTPTVTSPITYSGTLGSFIGGNDGTFACATCNTSNASVSSVALTAPSEFSISGSPITTSGTLALTESFSPNSILVSNTSGNGIIATGTQLTVGTLLATSTLGSATSTITQALRIATTAASRDNLLQIDCSGRTWPASISVGGCTSIDGGTVNQGTLLFVHENTNAVGTGRMVNFIQDNSTVTQDMFLASSGCANCTALNLKGFPTGKGILKIEHTGSGTGFSNSSMISLDGGNATDAQGIFMDWTGSATTGKLLQLKNGGVNKFDLTGAGNVGISSSTPGTIFSLGTTNGINFDNTATSTFGTGAAGINILKGCYAIAGVCIGGGTGSGTVTSVGLSDAASSLTIGSTPVTTSGTITATINLAHTNTWTSNQYFSAAVGIGTTTPHTLSSFDIASNTPYSFITDNDGPLGAKQWYSMVNDGIFSIGTTSDTAFTSTSTAFSISAPTTASPGTTFGIATTAPWRTLAVTGTVGFDGLTGSSGLQVGILCLSATKEVINESVACVASAKRFKENIQPLGVGLDELLKLKPVSFDWKQDYNGALETNPNFSGTQYSLIADDVKKIDPNLVTVETETTTFEGVKYPAGTVHGLADTNHWVALFTKSIQDFYGKFQALVARVSGLEVKVAKQQKEIDSLQAQINALKK